MLTLIATVAFCLLRVRVQFFTPLFTSLKTKRVSYSTQVGFVTHDDLVIGYLLEQVPVKIPTLDRVISETYAIIGSRLSVNGVVTMTKMPR